MSIATRITAAGFTALVIAGLGDMARAAIVAEETFDGSSVASVVEWYNYGSGGFNVQLSPTGGVGGSAAALATVANLGVPSGFGGVGIKIGSVSGIPLNNSEADKSKLLLTFEVIASQAAAFDIGGIYGVGGTNPREAVKIPLANQRIQYRYTLDQLGGNLDPVASTSLIVNFGEVIATQRGWANGSAGSIAFDNIRIQTIEPRAGFVIDDFSNRTQEPGGVWQYANFDTYLGVDGTDSSYGRHNLGTTLDLSSMTDHRLELDIRSGTSPSTGTILRIVLVDSDGDKAFYGFDITSLPGAFDEFAQRLSDATIDGASYVQLSDNSTGSIADMNFAAITAIEIQGTYSQGGAPISVQLDTLRVVPIPEPLGLGTLAAFGLMSLRRRH